MVANTVLVRPRITDTVLSNIIGHVDVFGPGATVIACGDRPTRMVAVHGVGPPVDHRHGAVGFTIGHVNGVGRRVHRGGKRCVAYSDGGRHGVGPPVDHRHAVIETGVHVDGAGARVHRDRV